MSVSVIIPIGNFQANKENLKNIIFDCPEEFFELIMVLDTDEKNAYETLRSLFESRDFANFKVVISNSRNPGGSRNLGKAYSSSEWEVFCDCDDRPNFQAIEAAVRASSNNDQIIMGSFQIMSPSGEVRKYIMQRKFDNCLPSVALTPGIWRWIIRRDLVKDIDFHPLSMGEDQLFILQILSTRPQIRISQEIVYSYKRWVPGSLTSDKSRISDLGKVISIERKLHITDPDIQRLRNYFLVKQILTLLKFGTSRTKLEVLKNWPKPLNLAEIRDIFYFLAILIWNPRSD